MEFLILFVVVLIIVMLGYYLYTGERIFTGARVAHMPIRKPTPPPANPSAKVGREFECMSEEEFEQELIDAEARALKRRAVNRYLSKTTRRPAQMSDNQARDIIGKETDNVKGYGTHPNMYFDMLTPLSPGMMMGSHHTHNEGYRDEEPDTCQDNSTSVDSHSSPSSDSFSSCNSSDSGDF